jgi:AcrR family transcriptional regulator
MPLSESAPLDDTAKLILDAASRRFLHYGFAKTTMSEIAADCNMSTGNLYRFFPSKLDIAEAFVRALRGEQLNRLKEAIREPDLSPEERLRRFFMTKLRLAYDRFHDRPKAYELSLEIITARPAFAGEWETAEALLIAEILSEGERMGSFPVADRARLARLLQDACFRFTTSAVFHEGALDELQGELTGVIDLLLDGLKRRAEGQTIVG